MECDPKTPKRKREGFEDSTLKRQRLCESNFNIPLAIPLEPTTSTHQLHPSYYCTPQPAQLAFSPEPDDMRRPCTRSVTFKVGQVAKWHPDSELIKGEITDTGMGVHLRWEYPEHDTPSDAAGAASLAAVSAPVSRVPSFPSLPSLSSSSSVSSIGQPSLTMMSSDDDEGAIDSRPQTPDLDDSYDPGSVVHTPTKGNRGLRRMLTQTATEPCILGSTISGIEDTKSFQQQLAEQQKREYEIHLEQMQKLQAWRKIKDQEWEEAEAAGLFESQFFEEQENRNDQDDQEGSTDTEMDGNNGGDVAMGSSEDTKASQSSLDRLDTWACLPLEPPSKMRPTLSKPQLPYMRTDPFSESQISSSSSGTTHPSAIPASSSSCAPPPRPPSHSAPASLCHPPRSTRCVRRVKENGVWKTVGSWDDLPEFAHLARYNSLKSLSGAQPHVPELMQVCRPSRLDPVKKEECPVDWPAALSRQSTATDIEAASKEIKGLTTRPRLSRHSI